MSLLRGSEGIICPQSCGPNANPLHELHVRVQNAAHHAAEPDQDEDGEYRTPIVDKVYSAVAYEMGGWGTRMKPYAESVSGMLNGSYTTIQAAWFQCPICGLILPAVVVP